MIKNKFLEIISRISYKKEKMFIKVPEAKNKSLNDYIFTGGLTQISDICIEFEYIEVYANYEKFKYSFEEILNFNPKTRIKNSMVFQSITPEKERRNKENWKYIQSSDHLKRDYNERMYRSGW